MGLIVCRKGSIVALLVDKVAFTLDEAYRKMRILEVSRERTTAITQMIRLTMTSLNDASVRDMYWLRDWHTQNIAFSTATHTECPIDMKLIDWGGHYRAAFSDPRDRMEKAMEAVLRSLPGPHTWGTEAFFFNSLTMN